MGEWFDGVGGERGGGGGHVYDYFGARWKVGGGRIPALNFRSG